MILPGHIITAKLAARMVRGDEKVAVTASLFPDVVDKALNILGWSPSGRIPAHSLLVGLASTLLAGIMGFQCAPGQRWGRSWAAGYFAHLAGDIEAGLPWLLYPIRYERDVKPSVPMAWLFGGEEPVPTWTLLAEALLVIGGSFWGRRKG